MSSSSDGEACRLWKAISRAAVMNHPFLACGFCDTNADPEKSYGSDSARGNVAKGRCLSGGGAAKVPLRPAQAARHRLRRRARGIVGRQSAFQPDARGI